MFPGVQITTKSFRFSNQSSESDGGLKVTRTEYKKEKYHTSMSTHMKEDDEKYNRKSDHT